MRVAVACCALLVVAAACRPQSLYGPLEGNRVAPVEPGVERAALPGFEGPGTSVIRTNLSPAVLLHSEATQIRLLDRLKEWGVGGPQHLAMPMRAGIRMIHGGHSAHGPDMSEAWLLVWFNGAEGWTHWDVPWLVILQHRPERVSLGEGLKMTFASAAGHIALMPLHGFRKLSLSETADWQHGLPGGVLARCRWWASALREFPYAVTEEAAVDFSQDAVLMRSHYEYISIRDDWDTRRQRFAPLSPVLGLAYLGGNFPMSVSEKVHDPDIFTPYGPYLGVVGDSHTVRFNVAQYIHETEKQQQPTGSAHPAVKLALEQIRKRMSDKFRKDDMGQVWDHGGPNNYCWQVMGDRWYAKALAYTPEPARGHAIASLRQYFSEFVLQEDRYRPFRDKLLLVGPGIGTWGGYDDAGKFSSNLLETLWCYAHYTGDWEPIRRRWPMIRRLLVTPAESSWRSFGRVAIAEMGDEAAPCLAMARMAYRVGDRDTFVYASYLFARELIHHYVKCKPQCAEYFRNNQPWHSAEEMPREVYLTNLWGDVAGWQIDGPTYPAETGERQYSNRWVRFSNEDVARFHRDVLADEMHAEMDLLLSRPDCPYKAGKSTAHIAPSIEQLRSLLLNEDVDRLAAVSPMDEAKIGRPADAISYYMSFARLGAPTTYERLIPPDQPATAFVIGLERETRTHDTCLTVGASCWWGPKGNRAAAYPVLATWGWPTPEQAGEMPFGSGKRWVFGQIATGDAAPATVSERRINWTTSAYEIEPGGNAAGGETQ